MDLSAQIRIVPKVGAWSLLAGRSNLVLRILWLKLRLLGGMTDTSIAYHLARRFLDKTIDGGILSFWHRWYLQVTARISHL